MKKLLLATAVAALTTASFALTRLPTYEQVAGLSNQVSAVRDKLDFGVIPSVDNLKATLEALKIEFSKNRICEVTIRLNADGTDYELPASETERAKLLEGAKLVFEQQGIDTPLVASLTSLTNAVWRQTLYVTDASTYSLNVASGVLGRSDQCGYGIAAVSARLQTGGNVTIDLTTHSVTGEVVEVARVQPYTTAASPSGASFLATRITTSGGTVWHTGGYAYDNSWVDQSFTKVVIHDCPANGEPQARVVSDGGTAENSIDLMQRLECLRSIKLVSADFAYGNTTITSNMFVRFKPVYVKTVRERVPIHTFDENGVRVATVPTDCIVKFFCDQKLDADYHLLPLFERYETQEDNSVVTTPLPYGYIARYPIQTQNVSIDGTSYAIARSKSDASREVGATRANFLAYCKNVNRMNVTIHADGESDVVVSANSDPRFASMCSIADIDFISNFAYLFFGANVQATMPGICTSAVSSSSNGATDYIVRQGIWTGAANTASTQNSCVFLGVEDATWSSTGWMHPDWINLWKRIVTTDATGAIAQNTTTNVFLFCQDRLLYNPCNSSTNYNNTTTTEEYLLANGYRYVTFLPSAGSNNKYRLGYDESVVMRDAFLPAADNTQENISMGASDYMWQGSAPATIANFSASTAYSIGSYVLYDGVVYKALDSVAAGAWNSAQWQLQSNQTITLRNWYMVARGTYRNSGSYLGIASVHAYSALSASTGGNWRARLSLQPVPAAE